MSWLNLNQSLNSLKGQITNFASEVLSEGAVQESGENPPKSEASVKDLEEKCRNQELEISALKRLNEELEATLQSEKFIKKNGLKDEESSWYWDPPPRPTESPSNETYKQYIKSLQDEISALKNSSNNETTDRSEEINRLREENKTLTSNLEDLDNQHQVAMEKLLTLKKELQKNFEVLKEEHDTLKHTNSSNASRIQDLENELKQKDEEIAKLTAAKSDYETLHHKYMNLEKVHSMLKENAEKFQEENQELHEEIFKLQERLTKQEHEIELATKHSEMSNMVPRETYELMAKELEDLKERRNSSQDNIEGINFDDNAKGVIENLKRDIVELKHKLTLKDDAEDDQKAIKYDKILQLYNKYVNFEIPVDYIGEIPSGENNTALVKLETVFKTLNSFKKDKDTLEHKLSEKNLNISHLQTQIDDLTNENDFLTSDIQQVERELNEMKKNNDFLISEIAALKNTSKLEPIIETHEDNIVKLETELADSNKLNKSFESKIVIIEKELAEVKTEKIALQKSLTDLKNKYTSMLTELETCKTETKEVEALELNATKECNENYKKAVDEIDDLKTKLHAANAKNEKLSIDIHIVENDKVLLTKELDDLKHVLEEKNSTITNLEKALEILKEKSNMIETMQNETMTLNTKLQTVISENLELKEKSNKIVTDNEHYTDIISKLKTEISSLNDVHEKGLDDLKHVLEEKNSTITNLERALEILKEKSNMIETMQNETMTLNTKLQTVISENLELKDKSNKIVTDNEHYTDIISKLKTEISSLNDVHEKELDDLKHALEEKNSTITNLEKALEILKEKSNMIEAMQNETMTLNTKLQTVINENLELKEKSNKILTDNEHHTSMISKLKSEISSLNDVHEKTLYEYNALKMSMQSKANPNEESSKIIEDLKQKLINQEEAFKAEILQLKEENSICLEKKLQVEAELASTDNKILQLEEEFEKLIAELNEKDSLIDSLNNNATQNAVTIKELNQNLSDLEKMVEIKNDEIQILNRSLKEATDKINEVSLVSERSLEEYKALQQEKEEAVKQVNARNEDLGLKRLEISNLTNTLNKLQTECAQHKSDIEKKDKEIESLTRKIEELTEKRNSSLGENKQVDENLLQEKQELEKNVTELKSKLETVQNEFQTALANLNKEKTELINLVTLKHNESVQYHAEIQRLNQVVLEQNQKINNQTVEAEKDKTEPNCENCVRLKRETDMKDILIIKLKDQVKNCERLPYELSQAHETIQELKEEVATLNASLTKQLENVKTLKAIKEKMAERMTSEQSKKEIERLRLHLLEIENNQTQEVMTLEQKLSEYQSQMYEYEKKLKQSNNVYKSNTIRWNQELDTLRNQLKLVQDQRDQIQLKMRTEEEKRKELEATLVNLQGVLDQFRYDKENEVVNATLKMRNKVEDLMRQNEALNVRVDDLNLKLQEAQNGLQAGCRLGDLVASKTAHINELKEQVRVLETSLAAAEERYYKAISNQQDKVDKNLLKNLVINFVIAAAHNSTSRHQILRILSTVLDFNQQECVKLGLVRSSKERESLAAEFVKFLQDESKPRPVLPNMALAQTSSRSNTPVSGSRKSSTADSQSIQSLGHQRNPSTGSNNLLFQNLESDAASQLSFESEVDRRQIDLETGVTQTRNNEGAILKYVLKDM